MSKKKLKCWKKEVRMGQTNYIKNLSREELTAGKLGIIIIQEIPKVDMKTAKVKGYTYSLKTNLKHSRWKRFSNVKSATTFAEKLMKKNNVC